MKTYNSKDVFWLDIRGKRSQLQKYKWTLDRNEKSWRYMTFEIRPDVRAGLIHQIKVELPDITDFDTRIMNAFDGCSCHPSIDSTQHETTIHLIYSATASDRLLRDSDVGPVYFISGMKRLVNEKEAKHPYPWDSTNEPEPVLAMVLEKDSGVSMDATNIFGEFLIEGDFPPDDKRRSPVIRH